MRRGLCLGLLAFLTGCPSVDVDPGETEGNLPALGGPTVEFDPGNLIIPFPNNLLFNPATGLLTIPEGACESATESAIRQGVLNALDGFGSYQVAATATFTEEPDPASFNGQVRLFKIADAGTPVTPAEVPVVIVPTGGDIRLDPTTCDPATATVTPQLAFIPMLPLEERATYAIGIYAGVMTTGGEDFIPSFTWGLIRQEENPVELDAAGQVIKNETPLDPLDADQLAQLLGINQLWRASDPALQGLDAGTGLPREDVLLAWSFNVQTLTTPLDPTVAGSLAETQTATSGGILGSTSLGGGMGEAIMVGALGAPTCAQVGCSAVGDVLGGAVMLPQFQLATANPLAGGDPIPGPWNNPRNPSMQGAIGTEAVEVLTFLPCSSASPGCTSPYADGNAPPTGFPVVMFGHGITRSNQDAFAIASQLNAAGLAVVAMNWVAHGSRAVQITDDAALGCSGTPAPEAAPQCFSPIVSSDLAGTRDNVRQSVLDGLGLVEAIKACGPSAACTGGLSFDSTKIAYVGQSLGAIIGSMLVASSPDFNASVLNVGGAGWIDVIENTDSLGLRCNLVDALIEAGIFADPTAMPFNPVAMTGYCVEPAQTWKTDPGYLAFAAVARWVLDPGEPANYFRKLIPRRVLIQEVIDDEVVPNISTDRLGGLLMLAPATADENVNFPAANPPSAAITTDPMVSKWVLYDDIAPGTGVGNTYSHGSLLSPATDVGTGDGAAGTAQMQTDAITWLLQNL